MEKLDFRHNILYIYMERSRNNLLPPRISGYSDRLLVAGVARTEGIALRA